MPWTSKASMPLIRVCISTWWDLIIVSSKAMQRKKKTLDLSLHVEGSIRYIDLEVWLFSILHLSETKKQSRSPLTCDNNRMTCSACRIFHPFSDLSKSREQAMVEIHILTLSVAMLSKLTSSPAQQTAAGPYTGLVDLRVTFARRRGNGVWTLRFLACNDGIITSHRLHVMSACVALHKTSHVMVKVVFIL